MIPQKNYIWNPSTCNCGNDKYLERVINDSLVICEEILEVTKTTAKKDNLLNRTFICFTHLFINYYNTIDDRQYLLLLHKTWIKAKTLPYYNTNN